MEDWLRIISRRLKNLETPLSADSWNRFENMLPRPTRRIWPWLAASFASVAAAATLFFFNRPESAPVVNPTDIPSHVITETSLPQLSVPDSSNGITQQVTRAHFASARSSRDESLSQDGKLTDIPKDDAVPQEDSSRVFSSTLQEDVKQTSKTENPFTPFNYPAETKRFPKRILLATYVSGWEGITSTHFTDGWGQLLSSGGIPANPVYSHPIVSSYHSIPLSFGLHVSYLFHPRFTLTSGMELTGYNSGISFSSQPEHLVDQRVYYLGLPLKVDCMIWSGGRFSSWLGAGAEIDRCVYATLDGKRVKENTFHWSAMADMSIQYELSDHLNLFLEPTLTHSFKSKNPGLQTYRTEHPLMFTVGAGLRIDF